MASYSPNDEIYSDGIGQSRHEVERILCGLEQHETGTPPNERRSEPRYRCKAHPKVPVVISDEDSLVGKYRVIARNISSKGLGFLFGQLVDPGNRCTILLETVDGKIESVAGTVVRCCHLEGCVHDVGLMFDEPIELTNFVLGVDALLPDQVEKQDRKHKQHRRQEQDRRHAA